MNGPAHFDLDAAAQLDAAELVLRHPVTGAPTAARITLAGPEHEARKAFVFARMRKHRAEFERAGRIAPTDPQDDAADEVAMLVACTLGWDGLAVGGQPLAYSADACTRLYNDPRRAWVRDQVKAALDQRALFIAGSAAS